MREDHNDIHRQLAECDPETRARLARGYGLSDSPDGPLYCDGNSRDAQINRAMSGDPGPDPAAKKRKSRKRGSAPKAPYLGHSRGGRCPTCGR